METIRTPDDRFVDLPDYPFAPALRRDPRRRRRLPAGPLPRRGPGRRGARAAAARRAVVELPVPPHDPAARRRRPPRRRARPRRLRTQRQADDGHRLQLRPAHRLDVGARVRRARPARHHVLRPGLGWADRAPPRRRPARPLRPRRRRQHRTADRRGRAERCVPGLAAVLPGVTELPDRQHRQRRLRHRPRTRGDRRLRRAVPRRHVQGRRPHLPVVRADEPRRSRVRPPTSRRGPCCREFDKPFLVCFSDRDPITKGGDAPFLAKVPGAQRPTAHDDRGRRSLPPGGRGPELARVIVDFIATTTP